MFCTIQCGETISPFGHVGTLSCGGAFFCRPNCLVTFRGIACADCSRRRLSSYFQSMSAICIQLGRVPHAASLSGRMVTIDYLVLLFHHRAGEMALPNASSYPVFSQRFVVAWISPFVISQLAFARFVAALPAFSSLFPTLQSGTFRNIPLRKYCEVQQKF